MMDFAVLAMPRSMSRWLSVALGFNGHTCYHDILVNNVPYKAGHKRAGVCDTGSIVEAQKKVVVLRSPDECIASLVENYGLSKSHLTGIVYSRFKYLQELNEKTYWFSDLKDAHTIQDIQEFLLGESMSIDAINTLLTAKITVSREYIDKSAGEFVWHFGQQ